MAEASGLLATITRRLFGSPAKAVLIIASAALAAGICVNALTLQQGAHPNPIFGAGKPATIVARPPVTAVAKPQPAPQVARESAARESGATASIAPAVQPGTAAAVATAAPPVRRNDMIGDLLRGGPAPTPPQRPVAAPVQAKANAASGAPAAPKLAAPSQAAAQKVVPQKVVAPKATTQAQTQAPARPAAAKPQAAQPKPAQPKPAQPTAQAAARPEASTQVQSAQKALSKLGMGTLTADGVMGAGTRGAIERFEKAKGLPVTGVLGPKTLKALSAASGTTVR